MKHTLMQLPYAMDALAPNMSQETLEYHYSKHHNTYVTTLNSLIAGTEFEEKTLEDIITSSEGKIFNNAAQIWNHNLLWNTLSPNPSQPSEELTQRINDSFEDMEQMKTEFKNASLGRFGSGWVWLVDKGDTLKIYSTPNAENPLIEGGTALLGLDVWEHAYYIDYRNDRGGFVDKFWEIVDWEVVAGRLEK